MEDFKLPPRNSLSGSSNKHKSPLRIEMEKKLLKIGDYIILPEKYKWQDDDGNKTTISATPYLFAMKIGIKIAIRKSEKDNNRLKCYRIG